MRTFVDPTVILISSRADDAVPELLEQETASRSTSEEARTLDSFQRVYFSLISIGDQFRLPYLLEIRPSSEFNYQAASSKLVNLNIGSASTPLMSFVTPADVIVANDFGDDEAFGGHQGQLLKLAGWVDVDSKLSVSGLFAAFIVQAKRQGWLRRRCCNVPPKTKSASILARGCSGAALFPHCQSRHV